MTFEQALLDCSPPSTSSTRTSSRTKPKPLSAVAQRAALANGGRKNGRAASPADSLSSLEDDEVDPDEVAAVQAAVGEPVDPVPPVLAADAPVPEASPLIRALCELFQENLKPIKELTDYHGKKTWFHFIINFVSNRFNADPYYHGGFRWETNLLRTKGRKPGQETEQKFWMLRWEDKVRLGPLDARSRSSTLSGTSADDCSAVAQIHLMRIMVDYQLVNAPPVREIIKENYDMCVLARLVRSPPFELALTSSLSPSHPQRQPAHRQARPRVERPRRPPRRAHLDRPHAVPPRRLAAPVRLVRPVRGR